MSFLSNDERPISGVGVGLRSRHMIEILNSLPDIPWLELLADNHLAEGGLIKAQLESIAEHYPLTLHCVGMSLASTEPLDKTYCQRIKALSERVNATWISEHLCFTSAMGVHSHDLLPIPYNQKSLNHCADRIMQIQDLLGERLLVENVSSYMAFKKSEMTEIEFIAALAKKADCYLLADVNNIYVNQMNQGLDAEHYIDSLPIERIKEIHLAGYQQQENFLLDAHNNPVSEPVWELYQRLIQRKADIPTLIEWDNDIPPLQTLLEEAAKATKIMQQGGGSVMSFKSIQQGFIRQLTYAESADEFLGHLEACGRLLPEQQLAIYQNNVRGALQNSLAQGYPVCRKVLGENYFKQLASLYIKKQPSKHHDLNGYGEYFPAFVQSQCLQRSELNDFSYLSDLAQLEWFYQQVYYAPDTEGFDFSAFAQLTEQQQQKSVLQLVSCLKLISSDYPILSIWQMNQEDSNSCQALDSKPEKCSIFRNDSHQIELLAIDTETHDLLTLIEAEKTLGELALMGYGQQLPDLIRHGWVCSFKVMHV